MSQYGSGWTPSVSKGLLELLLAKSASVRGFFLPHHSRSYKGHLRALASMWTQGRLDVSLDPTHFVCVALSFLLTCTISNWLHVCADWWQFLRYFGTPLISIWHLL